MSASRKTRLKVGVIGLGIIGNRVAANLRGAGHQVYVWSRTPRAAPNFLGSVVEVADLCDVIQLFVSDDVALEEVTRIMGAALSPRHVVMCHATVSPDATKQAAVIVESQGARYLDAPFTGSKVAAQNKQLVYYIGGGKGALEEVRPILEATSKAILHVGGIGAASVLKIATNMLTASTVQTLAESLALVRAAGIEGKMLVDALELNASRSGTSDLKLPAMIEGNFEANFSLKHMLKDVRLAQDLADSYELSLPVTDTAAEVMSLGIQNGWADQDVCVVAQLYTLGATQVDAQNANAAATTPEAGEKPAEIPVTAKTQGDPEPGATLPADPDKKPEDSQKLEQKEEATHKEEFKPSDPSHGASNGHERAVSGERDPALPALVLPPREDLKVTDPDPAAADKLQVSAELPVPVSPRPPNGLVPHPPEKPFSVPLPPGALGKLEKKSTLRMIRDFFKPIPTKPN